MSEANLLSIDFESWMYADIPEHRALTSEQRKELDSGYIKRSTEGLLSLLDTYKTKATFFILADLFTWDPSVIDMIQDRGHEIAYHGHDHIRLTSAEILKSELRKSEGFIKKYAPKGFRAPEIFFYKEYFDIIKEYGFTYDSSIYSSTAHIKKYSGIWEVPITTSYYSH
ncbi:polysaccharide deacetylase family protein, partial [Spirochaetota bacterium]